jgi:hypothetical protein
MASQPPFRIGLCLAGAVSAGAYTAGVIDYLIEALQEWQKRKDQQTPNTPLHNIQIPIIGGASAGGMTGIILASAINQTYTPLSSFSSPLEAPQPSHKLYHSWVDLLQDDMFPLLLKTDDIKTKQIYSFLNSSFIDQIAARVVEPPQSPMVNPPFIDPNLKLFTTLTNLKGFEYNVAFKATANATREYIMSLHNDYACFELNKSSYSNDGWMPLDFFNGTNKLLARNAAMATGAFPLGLKAREVVRDAQYIKDNFWLKDILVNSPFASTQGNVTSINVDGGIINNEPFEKVQDVLRKITNDTDQSTYNTFNGTVLMIDPFPSEEEEFNGSDQLMTVAGNTFSAMLAQARVKPIQLQNAWDPSNPHQFLIAPTRSDPRDANKRIDGSLAIACGALGGFSGFMHKHFRIHDFFLGRANCERFLRHYFTIPAGNTNPIFVEGYNTVADRNKFTSAIDEGLQIIPVFTNEKTSIPLPQFPNGTIWPTIQSKQIDDWDGLLRKRVQSLLMNFDDYRWDTRALLWIGAQAIINRKAADMALKTIKKSLNEHQLIK